MSFVLIRAVTKTRSGRKAVVNVGKKVSPLANQRNKTKRRLRSILRPLFPLLRKKAVVIFAKPGIQKLSFEDLKKEVEKEIRKIV